jgi:hypothetical protein
MIRAHNFLESSEGLSVTALPETFSAVSENQCGHFLCPPRTFFSRHWHMNFLKKKKKKVL